MNLFDQSFSRRQLIHNGLAGGVATATAALFGNSQGSMPDHKGATATGVKMASRQSIEQYPVGIEIGESHVCVAVGERLQDGSIKLRSVSHRPNANPENFGTDDPWVSSAVACLGETLVEAEKSTGVMIKKVALAITSEQLRQKPCWYFSQDWIEAMLEQDRKERPSLSLGLDNYRSFERHREKRWRARGWTETERRWRRFHHAGSNSEAPCFICSADGVIDRQRLEDCLQLEQGTIVADLDWWIEWVESGCSEHGVDIGRLVHSGVACAEWVLSAVHKEQGALVLQVEEESVSLALYGGGRLLWSDCLRAASYFYRGFFDYPLQEPPPDWFSKKMENIRDRCLIEIPADATLHLAGAWAAEPLMVEMAEAVFNRRVVQTRAHEGVFGCSDWLSDPRYACAIGLLKFA
jgi:hypothetical protein